MAKVVMNEKRQAIVNALANATEALTLKEIGEILGMDVKSGTTNAMVQAGIIKAVGTKKVAKITYVEVSTYELADDYEQIIAASKKTDDKNTAADVADAADVAQN